MSMAAVYVGEKCEVVDQRDFDSLEVPEKNVGESEKYED